jgi:hypothetical protein
MFFMRTNTGWNDGYETSLGEHIAHRPAPGGAHSSGRGDRAARGFLKLARHEASNRELA